MKQKAGILFLAGILLVGLLTIFSYGAYLDQTSEQRILFANIEEYLLHLPGEEPGLVKDLQDFHVLKISIDEDRDHGMAIYYPAFVVWYLNQVSPYLGSVFWHIYTFLLVFWGMCSLYLLCKEMFRNKLLAGVVTLLFFLTPRMFAESHYNNKDMVLLSLCFTLFYWGWRLQRETSWKSVVMFALAGALAFNMKIIGAWIFGILGLYALGYLIAKKRFDRKALWKTLCCVGLWALLYFVLTPACWSDIKGFFQYLFHYAVDYDLWHDYVLFDGRMLHQEYTGMPRKYLPVLILLTVPVLILAMAVAGFLWAVVDILRSRGMQLWENAGYLICMGLAVGVPLAYAVLAATPLYNGWRHFYFVYASIIMGAGYFLWRFFDSVAHWKAFSWNWRKIFQGGILAYLIVLAVGIGWNYPQEHSYYNILAGDNVVERFELDYWDMSVKQAYEAIGRDAEEVRKRKTAWEAGMAGYAGAAGNAGMAGNTGIAGNAGVAGNAGAAGNVGMTGNAVMAESVGMAVNSRKPNNSQQIQEKYNKVRVGALNYPTIWGLKGNHKVLPRQLKEQIVVEEDWQRADYLIVNTTYANMYSRDEYRKVREHYDRVTSFTSYGNIICEVFRQ